MKESCTCTFSSAEKNNNNENNNKKQKHSLLTFRLFLFFSEHITSEFHSTSILNYLPFFVHAHKKKVDQKRLASERHFHNLSSRLSSFGCLTISAHMLTSQILCFFKNLNNNQTCATPETTGYSLQPKELLSFFFFSLPFFFFLC